MTIRGAMSTPGILISPRSLYLARCSLATLMASKRANLPKVRCPPLAAPASFAPTKQTKRKTKWRAFSLLRIAGERQSGGGAAIKCKRERLAFPPLSARA